MIECEKFDNVIKSLECCNPNEYQCGVCHYDDGYETCARCKPKLHSDALALLKSLNAFKAYFDSFYGEGLEIANYHQNGAMEPFDNFYDSAMEEYDNA